jgi:hypothetical protein
VKAIRVLVFSTGLKMREKFKMTREHKLLTSSTAELK